MTAEYPLPAQDLSHRHFIRLLGELRALGLNMRKVADATNISYRRMQYLKAGERRYPASENGRVRKALMTYPEQVVLENLVTSLKEMQGGPAA